MGCSDRYCAFSSLNPKSPTSMQDNLRWMIALEESAELARTLIVETCAKQGIEEDQLTLHSDRGSAMRSKSVAQLLIDLGVAKSPPGRTRPRTTRTRKRNSRR
jgi:transposase InsO family protein